MEAYLLVLGALVGLAEAAVLPITGGLAGDSDVAWGMQTAAGGVGGDCGGGCDISGGSKK